MDLIACINQMQHHAKIIETLTIDLTTEIARWRPAPDSWSVLEVVNHLLDEEREDFRVRLRHILEGRAGLPPPIDPAGKVTAHDYNARDLADSLSAWLMERAASLEWLRGLEAPEWSRAIEGPFGRVTAGDMLAAWVAHDVLHMRQLVELRWGLTTAGLAPYSTAYAGDW